MNVLKDLLDKLFLWCSDTDIPTLNLVDEQDRKSKRYQINYGRAVMIPAIMAAIGMAHALSDFTGNKLVYIGVGLLVGYFVFIIDRAIIATYEKQAGKLGSQFYIRIILSVVLGFVIALFFVFFFFQNRIDEQMRANVITKTSAVNTSYDNQSDTIRNYLNERKSFLEVLRAYEQAERTGGEIKTFTYANPITQDTLTYTTSGMPGESVRTKGIIKMIDKVETEIQNENSRIQARLQENETVRQNKLNEITDNAGKKDPLVKLEALVVIISEHLWLLLFIIPLYLTLLAFDIIPILVKELAQPTKYDNYFRNKELSKNDLTYDKYKATAQKNFDNSYSELSKDDIAAGTKKPAIQIFDKLKTAADEVNGWVISILGVVVIPLLWLFVQHFGAEKFGITQFGINVVLPLIISILGNSIYKIIETKK